MNEREWRTEAMEWMQLANEAAANEKVLKLKLDLAVKALEQIVHGDPTEHCVQQWYSVARNTLAEIRSMK